MKSYCFIVFSFIFFCSCLRVSEEESIGMFVSQNNINTIDTVWIQENGTYVNSIYRKKDQSLVYRNTGKWKYSDGYIYFYKFYSEEDSEHSYNVKSFEDVLMTTMLPLERRLGKIIIHHKSMYDNIYLEKIE